MTGAQSSSSRRAGKQLHLYLFSLGFDFFEASAKENISVRQAFERLVDAICDKMSDSLDTDSSVLGASKTTRLSDTPPLLQQNCSC